MGRQDTYCLGIVISSNPKMHANCAHAKNKAQKRGAAARARAAAAAAGRNCVYSPDEVRRTAWVGSHVVVVVVVVRGGGARGAVVLGFCAQRSRIIY